MISSKPSTKFHRDFITPQPNGGINTCGDTQFYVWFSKNQTLSIASHCHLTHWWIDRTHSLTSLFVASDWSVLCVVIYVTCVAKWDSVPATCMTLQYDGILIVSRHEIECAIALLSLYLRLHVLIIFYKRWLTRWAIKYFSKSKISTGGRDELHPIHVCTNHVATSHD